MTGVTELGLRPEDESILGLASVVIRGSNQAARASVTVIGLSDALWSKMRWGSKTFGLFSSGAGERFAVWRLPAVIVMQTAQHWMRDGLSIQRGLIWSLWMAGNALLYRLVWSGIVEVGLILLRDPMQMSLAQDEEEIQALPPHTTQKALADGIGLWRDMVFARSRFRSLWPLVQRKHRCAGRK